MPGMGAEKNGRAAFGLSAVLQIFGWVRILADIPGREGLPEQYGWLGFRRAYLYRCYQKNQEEKSYKQMPEVVGADVYDRTGNGHLEIIEFPVPILKGNVEVIKSIREKLYEPEFSDLTVVDFSDLAQGCSGVMSENGWHVQGDGVNGK